MIKINQVFILFSNFYSIFSIYRYRKIFIKFLVFYTDHFIGFGIIIISFFIILYEYIINEIYNSLVKIIPVI